MQGTSAEEIRGYRDGQVDARLTSHDEHFAKLNGSMDENSRAIRELEKSTVSGFTAVESELVLIKESLQTIKQRRTDDDTRDDTRWERWRGIVAWSVGIVGFLVVCANFILRLLGIG